MKIILASKSPRRREILENLGVDFEVFTTDADENCDTSNPYMLVEELALRKGQAAYNALSSRPDIDDTLVISSDTVVYCKGSILGKPYNKENSVKMLQLLNDGYNEVISGVAVTYRGKTASAHEITKVYFDKMSEDDIDFYAGTGEPFDKAGGYAIQGLAIPWIKGIEGDYFNVVGLPVKRLFDLLRDEFGISAREIINSAKTDTKG